jgi:hypothetical protein
MGFLTFLLFLYHLFLKGEEAVDPWDFLVFDTMDFLVFLKGDLVFDTMDFLVFPKGDLVFPRGDVVAMRSMLVQLANETYLACYSG